MYRVRFSGFLDVEAADEKEAEAVALRTLYIKAADDSVIDIDEIAKL